MIIIGITGTIGAGKGTIVEADQSFASAHIGRMLLLKISLHVA